MSKTYLNRLFEPLKVGGIELKNRLVMVAAQTHYGEDGRVGARSMNYWVERAKGGVGMIMITLRPVAYSRRHPNDELISADEFLPGLRELTRRIHEYDAKVCAQFSIRSPLTLREDVGPEVVGPSNVNLSRDPKAPAPRPIATAEIAKIVQDIGEAVRRARDAGFDAVEILAGQGNLICQFLSPYTNKRTDEYGGSLENRMRFLLEVIDSARRKAGNDYTLSCRLIGEDLMEAEGSQTIEELKKAAPIVEKAGIDLINETVGWHESRVAIFQNSVAPGGWVYVAQAFKGLVSIPVVAGIRIGDPLLAERILEEGKADLIGMARPLFADPELPNKAKEGRFDEIRPCINCGLCFDRVMAERLPAQCSVNPRMGREGAMELKRAQTRKRVFVVGGGPAGMEAARAASLRGHDVTLWESKDRLGGQLLVTSIPPYKDDIAKLTRYMARQVSKSGAQVRLASKATADLVERAQPDVVILATGALPVTPGIPGINGRNVVTALDVLAGAVDTGTSVVVVGGGLVGCETAEFLASKGKKVTILEMLGRIGSDITRSNRFVIMRRLREAHVIMKTGAKVVEIADEGARVEQNGSTILYGADTVVLAVGAIPNDGLAGQLEGKLPDVRAIGDCTQPQRIAQAIESGFLAGCEI